MAVVGLRKEVNRQRIAQELVKLARELAGVSRQAADFIDAYTIEKGMKNIEEAKRIAASEMPQAKFVFVGMDSKFIFFNVVARSATEDEIRDIKEKTRFYPLSENTRPIYKGEFKMRIM